MLLASFPKDPDAVLDYYLDWDPGSREIPCSPGLGRDGLRHDRDPCGNGGFTSIW